MLKPKSWTSSIWSLTRQDCQRSFRGQQQRGAGTRLITSPQILLLDEPLSALDPFLRLRMRSD